MIVLDQHDTASSTTKSGLYSPSTSQRSSSDFPETTDSPSSFARHGGIELTFRDPPPSYEPPPSERSPLYTSVMDSDREYQVASAKSRAIRRFWQSQAIAFFIVIFLAFSILMVTLGGQQRRNPMKPSPDDIGEPDFPTTPDLPGMIYPPQNLPHTPAHLEDLGAEGEIYHCSSSSKTWRPNTSDFDSSQRLSSSYLFSFEPKSSLYLKSLDMLAQDSGALLVTHHNKTSIEVFVTVHSGSPSVWNAYDICLYKSLRSWTVAVTRMASISGLRPQFDFEIRLPRDSNVLSHLGTTLMNYEHTLGRPGENLVIDTLRLVSEGGKVHLESVVARQIDVAAGLRRVSGSVTASEFAYIENYGDTIDVDITLDARSANVTPGVLLKGVIGTMTAGVMVIPPPKERKLGAISIVATNAASSLDVGVFLDPNSTASETLIVVSSGLSHAELSVDKTYVGYFLVAASTVGPDIVQYEVELRQPRVVHLYEKSSNMARGFIADGTGTLPANNSASANRIILSSAASSATLFIDRYKTWNEWRVSRRRHS